MGRPLRGGVQRIMEQPHTEPTTAWSAPPPVAAIVAGIGGLSALIGVFLDWATITTSFEGGQFAGQQLPAFTESVGTAQGLDHWTGIVALVASVVAVAGAIGSVVVQDSGTRRIAVMAAIGGGLVALLTAIVGMVVSESIAVSTFPGGSQALEFARQFAEQLGGQGFRIHTGPSLGVFVTALGGAAAAGGGFMALRQAGPQSAAPAHQPPVPDETQMPGDPTA
jgi:hypothetical protein